MLVVGAALVAAAVWLKDYRTRHGYSFRVYYVEPEWADPLAAATGIIGAALVLLALARMLRRT